MVINLCEMKYSINVYAIDRDYDAVLRNKIDSFRRENRHTQFPAAYDDNDIRPDERQIQQSDPEPGDSGSVRRLMFLLL